MKAFTKYSFIISILIVVISSCSKSNISPSSNSKKVTDFDGNVYDTVVIGTQTWMKENLQTTHYRNGDPIPEVEDSINWISSTSGAWCYYEKNTANGIVYGKLYNLYAVHDPRGLTPAGWHIPSIAKWTILTDYLGGPSEAAGKMKEIGTSHWVDPNTDVNDSSGFTALPAGDRYENGRFEFINTNAVWWSSTSLSPGLIGSYLFLYNTDNSINIDDYGQTHYALSVRCVKD